MKQYDYSKGEPEGEHQLVPMSPGETEILADIGMKHARDGVRIVDVGAGVGASTLGLTKVAIAYKGVVFAVDIWRNLDRMVSFINRIEAWPELKSMVFPMHMPSELASTLFENDSLDIVFIDADHRYSEVMKDLKAWFPKVRKGGILCGHDCEMWYSEYTDESKQEIDKNKEGDRTSFTCHAGVTRALYDMFNDKYSIAYPSTIWGVVK